MFNIKSNLREYYYSDMPGEGDTVYLRMHCLDQITNLKKKTLSYIQRNIYK